MQLASNPLKRALSAFFLSLTTLPDLNIRMLSPGVLATFPVSVFQPLQTDTAPVYSNRYKPTLLFIYNAINGF
jgi:hypothetical protein